MYKRFVDEDIILTNTAFEKLDNFLDNIFDLMPFNRATSLNKQVGKDFRNLNAKAISVLPTTPLGLTLVPLSFGASIACTIWDDSDGDLYAQIEDITFSSALLPYTKPRLKSSTSHSSLSISPTPHKYTTIKEVYKGVFLVRYSKGKYNYVDSNGKLFCQSWFTDYRPFHKCKAGIVSFVNISGQCHAFNLNNKRLYNMNKAWKDCFAESIFSAASLDRMLLEQISSTNTMIRLTQSDLRMIIESVVYRYMCSIDEQHSKQQLNEKFYNPLREPMIDGHIGEYEVLDGAEWEQILCDLPEKGWVEDIRMYSAMEKGGKTYCLYRRKDNGKYFFIEVYDDLKDEKYLRSKAVPKKNVPDFILNDAISLIRHS